MSMPTLRERVLDFLHTNPQGADDDVLAARVSAPQRQSVNQVCRQLESQGLIVRRRDPVVGKIVNQLADSAAAPEPTVAPTVHGPNNGRASLVLLADAADIQRFAYAAEVRLAEDDVKRAMQAVLIQDGWQVDVRWGRAQGIDIEARRGAERLVLEAKGEGSLQPMRVNYFVGALGELLQRMDSPDAFYGLALPAHRQFAGLVTRLPSRVRTRLNLRFYLVRQSEGGYEVGLLSSGDEGAQVQLDPQRYDGPSYSRGAEAL